MELAFSIVSHIRPDRSSWLCGDIWVPALLGVKQTNKVDIRLSLGTNIVYDCYHIGKIVEGVLLCLSQSWPGMINNKYG